MCLRLYHATIILHCHWWEFWSRDMDVLIILSIIFITNTSIKTLVMAYNKLNFTNISVSNVQRKFNLNLIFYFMILICSITVAWEDDILDSSRPNKLNKWCMKLLIKIFCFKTTSNLHCNNFFLYHSFLVLTVATYLILIKQTLQL